jgi:Ala-tRNA(Pro) deacylase
MVARNIRKFLDEHGVKYVVIQHSAAFTAQEIAAAAHIPGKEIAKTVIVKIGQDLAMAVVPASKRLSLETLAAVTGRADVEIAREYEFQSLFQGCELGAMPPFGNLYDMVVYVDPALSEDREIAFNAGTHTDLIRMRYDDFERLVKPKVLSKVR